ncbi:MAG TPA: hypothetical protein VM577_05475, partial [Anaerovoracaceae bacterium]|nr:hypothetical protein [Anaerovoracaceae bacterium]
PHDREVYMISKLYFDRDFWGWNVSESEITSPDIAKADGAQCLKCKDFVYMAPADGSFICRSCVLDPYRCSSVWNGDD